MQRRTWLLTGVALAFSLLMGAGGVSAEIYHWVDKTGTPHFSDRAEEVPPAYRDQIVDYEEELEGSTRVNIIEGLNRPSPSPGAPPGEGVEYSASPSAMPEIGDLSDFAADPTAMLERLQGPMMALAVALTLVLCGFLLAFMAMGLLVGCRLVGQASPGFKKAYGIVIVQFLAGLVIGPGVVVIFGPPDISDLGGVLRLQAINLGALLLVHSVVLRGMLCDSMGKSIGLAIVVNLVLLGLAFLLGLGFAMCAGGAALFGAS
jgi:hypothetical protein